MLHNTLEWYLERLNSFLLNSLILVLELNINTQDFYLLPKKKFTQSKSFKPSNLHFLDGEWWKVAQSCPTLCDPMDCSLPGSSSMGFSRQEYWSNYMKQENLGWIFWIFIPNFSVLFHPINSSEVKWKLLSRVRLFVTPWAIRSMEFSRPEYYSG